MFWYSGRRAAEGGWEGGLEAGGGGGLGLGSGGAARLIGELET